MSKTLNEIAGGENLSGLIQAVKGGIPVTVPDEFMRVGQRVSGNTAKWQEVDGTRKLAQQVHRGSASKTMKNIEGVRNRVAEMISVFHNLPFDSELQSMLEDENGNRQKMGLQEIMRQVTLFKERFVNLRTAATLNTLSDAKIIFDGDGNLQPPGGSGIVEVDFLTPASNRDQLDVTGGGDIIAVSWDNPAAPIHQNVAQIRKAGIQKTGYQIRHAFYGEDVPEMFFSNTVLKELITHSTRLQDAMAEGEIASPFLKLQWHAVNESFFENQDGTIAEIFAADKVVFTPDPSPEWWDVMEGSAPVPMDVSVAADAMGIHSSITEINGMFSYATQILDPVGILQYAGDTFLPMLKVPKAIYIADVAF